jgi:hypothetical protein
MKTFEITIWDKAEHWTFTERFEAKDEFTAVQMARKAYPNKGFGKGGYVVKDSREVVK